MSSFSRTIAMSALVGVTMFAGPLTAMAADSVAPAAIQAAPVATPHEAPRETIEQRIASLHASLGITAGEEADWNGVTKVMRENTIAWEKLMEEKSAKDPASMTAVDDLMTYEKFARAHVQGLKGLTAAFTALYRSMPDAQKKIADQVFMNSGHEKVSAHG
jgi:periplasmic protein CpxP/Spy